MVRREIYNSIFVLVVHSFISCFVLLPLDRIYECSVLCRCDKMMCQNRVVQHGIQVRLQVFNTEKKGWGVRCLDDIDKGTFVCTYSGNRRWPVEMCSIILPLLCPVPWNFFENQTGKYGVGREVSQYNLNLQDDQMDRRTLKNSAMRWCQTNNQNIMEQSLSQTVDFSLTGLCILCQG